MPPNLDADQGLGAASHGRRTEDQPGGGKGQLPDTIRNGDLPTRICIKNSDKAGNFTDADVFDFGAPAMLPNAVRNAASLQRGTIAPGAAFGLDTFNLTDTTESSPVPGGDPGRRENASERTRRAAPSLCC